MRALWRLLIRLWRWLFDVRHLQPPEPERDGSDYPVDYDADNTKDI